MSSINDVMTICCVLFKGGFLGGEKAFSISFRVPLPPRMGNRRMTVGLAIRYCWRARLKWKGEICVKESASSWSSVASDY